MIYWFLNETSLAKVAAQSEDEAYAILINHPDPDYPQPYHFSRAEEGDFSQNPGLLLIRCPVTKKIPAPPKVAPDIQKRANAAARKSGYGVATSIVFDPALPLGEAVVLEHTCPGYRKRTTGEYVTSGYRANFGWKNTYYQSAETVVAINPE